MRGGALGAVGLASAALIGCGDDGDPAPTSTGTAAPSGTAAQGGTAAPEGTTPAAGSATPGGTLRWGMLSDLVSLDPHTIIGGQFDTLWQVWDGLTEYDKSLDPAGRLAESWEINEDSTEFVFHLREGVTWHSGREFTSDDVRYNLDRVTNPVEGAYGGASQLSLMGSWYNENLETPDEHTVIMKTSVPRPAVFDFFSQFRIGDRESLEGPDALKTAGGTGPFMFVEWRPGDQFSIVKNPNYWNPERPLLDEQVFHVGLDPQTAVQQFESGALDYLQDPPLRDFARLREQYQGLLHQSSGGAWCIGFNCAASGGTPESFTDKRVRQALNFAIDRERFAESILLGTVEPYSLPWPQGSMGYEEAKINHYQFDLEEARRLLDAAGVDTLETGIFTYTGLPEMNEFAEIYQQDLATIGVNTQIEAVEVANWAARVNENPPNYNGIYAAATLRANFALPVTMVNLGQALWSTTGVNNTGYYSDEWKALIEEFNLASDPAEQQVLASRMNDLLLDDTWITFVAPRPPRALVQNKVEGIYHFAVREGFEVADAWIS